MRPICYKEKISEANFLIFMFFIQLWKRFSIMCRIKIYLILINLKNLKRSCLKVYLYLITYLNNNIIKIIQYYFLAYVLS